MNGGAGNRTRVLPTYITTLFPLAALGGYLSITTTN